MKASIKKALTKMRVFNNIYSINTKISLFCYTAILKAQKFIVSFWYKEEHHPSTMLRIGRVPANLGASHYDGIRRSTSKKLHWHEAFLNLYIKKFFLTKEQKFRLIFWIKQDDFTKWSFETSGVYEWYSNIAEKRMSEKVRFFVAIFLLA